LARAARNKVLGLKVRKLEKWIAITLQSLDETRNNERLGAVVVNVAGNAYLEVLRHRRAIDVSNAYTIHRTRLAFKKFRYMMECLSPEITGLKASQLRVLALYQRKMGIIQ